MKLFLQQLQLSSNSICFLVYCKIEEMRSWFTTLSSNKCSVSHLLQHMSISSLSVSLSLQHTAHLIYRPI